MTSTAEPTKDKSVRIVFADASMVADRPEITAQSTNLQLHTDAQKQVTEVDMPRADSVAAREIEAAGVADEGLRSLCAARVDVERAIAEIDNKMEVARSERGDLLAGAKAPTGAINKQIASLRAEREELEDHYKALLSRVATAKREAQATRSAAVQARSAALHKVSLEADQEVALLNRRLQFAAFRAERLKTIVSAYATAMPAGSIRG
jgi:chromosome segregation ATPase